MDLRWCGLGDGGLIGCNVIFGDLVIIVGVMVDFVGLMVGFAGVMVGFVGVIEIFGANRGGGQGVGCGEIYCIVVIIGIVYVMVIEGQTLVVERNGFVVR